LLHQGADLNATDKWGQTALMLAAGRNDVTCTRILIEAGVDLNVRARNGLTALGYALENDQVDAARLLKRAKAR
jgi:ankyrin repeat protein